ncbi:vWA domain-containing protein [Catellatospora sp. NPDC049111]|uniref:vWA domain-containing protein n=1 Tax=Catellatospora sp. NPDC049111 TaxID=3155271 RepID=UPI0033CDC705
MSAQWSGDRHRLVVVPEAGLIGADRVGVSREELLQHDCGMLSLTSTLRLGVRLYPLAELPRGVVAIGADLAADHDIDPGSAGWQLAPQHAVTAASIVLEPMADGSLQDSAKALLGSAELRGRVLCLTSDAGVWTTVNGVPFRVRSAADQYGRAIDGLLRIGGETQLLLYGQSGRTGVDIVILADCSGSMSIQDVPTAGTEDLASWRAGQPNIDRGEALRRALTRMLDARLTTAGRISRIALVRFTSRCEVTFPREGGMAEMSADSDPAVGEAFRRAVLQVRPENDSTDIGGALHFASELLHRHGVPGNDQLIVLVSDGAEWNPKGEDATGEAIAATTDAVSLMDELYRAVGIRLHAIGISDEASFQRWWREQRTGKPQQPWMVPDHRLLSDLVRVGGGDPSRIGGLDVLVDYFGGLGSGITTRIGTPARESSPPPVQHDLAAFVRRAMGLAPSQRAELARLADEARQLYAACLNAAGARAELGLLVRRGGADEFATLGTAAQSRAELKEWITNTQKMFAERSHGLDGRLAALATDGRLERLRQVRDDAQPPYADDDAHGWFGLQQMLLRSVLDVLGDASQMIAEIVESGQDQPIDERQYYIDEVGWD